MRITLDAKCKNLSINYSNVTAKYPSETSVTHIAAIL